MRSLAAVMLLSLCVLVLAACGVAAQPTESPMTGTQAPVTMKLDWMVQGADAVVIGIVVRELEPSSVRRLEYFGDEPTMVTNEYRNFAVDVEEPFVPRVEDSVTIAVRYQTNPRIAGIGDPLPDAAGIPEIEVGQKVALFLMHTNRWAVDGVSPEPPEGFASRYYFGVLPSFYALPAGPFEAGGLVQEGDRWVHRPSRESVSQAELEQAIAEQARVVPSECLRISEFADYAGIETIDEFVEKADAVIKGRMGGEIAARRGDNAVDVLEVLGGEVDAAEIRLEGAQFKRPPGFDTCDYYMFLNKNIPALFLDEGVPSERPGVYRLTGGPQAAFAVHAGVVEHGGFSLPFYEFRGIPEEDFREAILESIERVGEGSE